MSARDKIIEAFRDLVLSTRYDAFKTQDVIERSQVARSTFYSHFNDKNDLLFASLGPILDVLADTCQRNSSEQELRAVLDHVWENRQRARLFFQPPMLGQLVMALTKSIEAKAAPSVESTFIAHGLAGTIGAWVTGRLSMTSADLAQVLINLSDAKEKT